MFLPDALGPKLVRFWGYKVRLVEGLETAGRDAQRELLERLATAVEVDPRKRTVAISWRLGGESRYRVPLFRGGQGRSVEAFMERVAESPRNFRVP